MSEKLEAIREALNCPPFVLVNEESIARELERRGWKYDPPKPVLPVVSEEALRALRSGSLAIADDPRRLRAAFKVMLKENLLRHVTEINDRVPCVRFGDDYTGSRVVPVRAVYRLLAGEKWPT